MNNILSMLGLAKKAGRVEIGEEPVGAAARAHDARLILLASDAADNTLRRARHFAEAGACLLTQIPATKDELGSAVGRTSCAMLAVTDIGFADAVAKKLAVLDAAKYGALSEKLSVKAERAKERKDPKRRQRREKRGSFRGSGAIGATNGSGNRKAATVVNEQARHDKNLRTGKKRFKK